MKYIVLTILLVIISVFVYYSYKFRNPYKLIFLFGKKGSGKSTLLVKYMIQYHKKGYTIYTDMKECTLPYVNHIEFDDVGKYVGEPRSCICLDEVGITMDNRKFKTFRDELRDYLVYQRQYKNVVILASQVWDIDKKAKDRTDLMFLCGKIGPLSYARKIKRGFTITEATSEGESRVADQLAFDPFGTKLTWIPRYQYAYASFSPPEKPYFAVTADTEDNVKKRIKK